MRKSTALWLVLAAFCSTSLFHTSQRVHDNREKISVLGREISKEEESIRVLQAEWSYLNQPKRLEKLARQHLKLEAMKGTQFAKAEDLLARSAAAQQPAAEEAAKTEVAAAPEPVAVKINPPPAKPVKAAQAPRVKQAHPVTAAKAPAGRGMADVLKSLGVQ